LRTPDLSQQPVLGIKEIPRIDPCELVESHTWALIPRVFHQYLMVLLAPYQDRIMQDLNVVTPGQQPGDIFRGWQNDCELVALFSGGQND